MIFQYLNISSGNSGELKILSLKKSTVKHLIWFFVILNLTPILSAQGRQGKALDPGSIISLTSKKGYLYNGIDNLLMVDPLLYIGADTLLIAVNNGLIVNDSSSRYLCIPSQIGTMWITLSSVKGSDTTLLGYKYFPVINIPEPLLTLDGRPIETPAYVSKNELLDCDSLGVHFSDDIAGSELWMVVTEFSLGYSYGGFYVSHANPSGQFTSETREIINRLGPDREISIRATVKSTGTILKQLPIYRIRIY
jgi:hypothetical protein